MEGSVYLKARQEWDERYADLVLGKRNWQITAAGMMAITLLLAFGMVWVSTRSKFVPYVVEVDKLGYAIGAPSALTENTSRISTDRMVLIGQVYSRARGPAYKFLENYYHENDLEHDPFKVAQHQSGRRFESDGWLRKIGGYFCLDDGVQPNSRPSKSPFSHHLAIRALKALMPGA
jgi:type IV secretory pathway TrbF-like protein